MMDDAHEVLDCESVDAHFYEYVLDRAHYHLVSEVRALRDEIARHHVAVGPTFHPAYTPGQLDRQQRMIKLREAEACLIKVLTKLDKLRQTLLDGAQTDEDFELSQTDRFLLALKVIKGDE